MEDRRLVGIEERLLESLEDASDETLLAMAEGLGDVEDSPETNEIREKILNQVRSRHTEVLNILSTSIHRLEVLSQAGFQLRIDLEGEVDG